MANVHKGGKVQAINTLATPALLVINDSADSLKADELLREAGVNYQKTGDLAAQESELPLVIHMGIYRGLKEIEGWLNLLRHWSATKHRSAVFVKNRK